MNNLTFDAKKKGAAASPATPETAEPQLDKLVGELYLDERDSLIDMAQALKEKLTRRQRAQPSNERYSALIHVDQLIGEIRAAYARG